MDFRHFHVLSARERALFLVSCRPSRFQALRARRIDNPGIKSRSAQTYGAFNDRADANVRHALLRRSDEPGNDAGLMAVRTEETYAFFSLPNQVIDGRRCDCRPCVGIS